MGVMFDNVESSAKKEERTFQSIGEVIQVDEEQEWVQNSALGNSSLKSERGLEGSINDNMVTRRVQEVINPGMKAAFYAKYRGLGKQSRMSNCQIPKICPRRWSSPLV